MNHVTDYLDWWHNLPAWIAWAYLPVNLALGTLVYLALLQIAPWGLRALTFLYRAHQRAHARWYRAKVDWKRARRDTPSYRKLSPTWRYRLRYWLSKPKDLHIAIPDVHIDKKVALRTRREWNRMRDMVAPIILERDGWYCAWCDTALDEDNWSIDHIIPISKGGTNDLTNLQAMCRPCNSIKGDRVDTWGKFWDKVAA